MTRETHVVTGAFGYTGNYIARELLKRGVEVRTLTNSTPRDSSLGARIDVHPRDFSRPEQLVESMRGARVLYNTYWVRFNYDDEDRSFSHHQAVENSRTLFRAAEQAGVERVVHVSVTNPSRESDLSYFRGKALVEQALQESRLSGAILRPALLFGREDILTGNIAWVLRRFPVFGVVGGGEYRLEPIYVKDFAELAVEQGFEDGDVVQDTVGPDTFTFRDYVRTIGEAIGAPRPIVSVPEWLGVWAARTIGFVKNDVLLTREEIRGLRRENLYTGSEPVGTTAFADWIEQHADTLGTDYRHELGRRE